MYSELNKSDNFENPFFVATVEDNNDPTFNYRVKVRIDQIHPKEIDTQHLPWAAKVDSSFMGIGSSTTLHGVPEVGSQVLVLAVGNNINSLLYLGSLYKKDNTPSNEDYLNCYGIYDKDGNYIKLNKIQKLLELIWAGKINIDKITEMNITVNGNVNLTANNTNITASNNTIKGNVSIDGTLNVTGLISGDADIRAGSGSVGLLTHTHAGVFPGPSSTLPGEG